MPTEPVQVYFPDREGNVTKQMLKDTFGFSAVLVKANFSENEITDCCNMVYDSFNVFAMCLNIPQKCMSLGGKLSISIGAKSMMPDAAAMYTHHDRKINFQTKEYFRHIAHEWMHALDHYLAYAFGDGKQKDDVFTNQLNTKHYKGREAVRDALRNLVDTIHNSAFYKKCKSASRLHKDPDYWMEDTELCARAFETYIFTKMQKLGYSNQNLVSLHQSPMWIAPGQEKKIMEAFSHLFKTFNTSKIDRYPIETTLNGTFDHLVNL